MGEKITFEVRVLAILLAVALQVQATLPLGEAGIRTAVSDLFLPIALLYTGLGLLTSRLGLRWRMPGVTLWLLAISAAMTLALFAGYRHLGHWSAWALVNKYAGWFALAAYFLIGTSIVRTGGLALRAQFVQTFVIIAAVVAGLNVIAMPWLMSFYTLPFGIEFNRATGAMQNANAFGFLLVVAILLVIASGDRIRTFLPPMLAALWFTSSRGALIALAVGVLSYLPLSPRRLLPALRPSMIALLAIAVVTGVAVLVEPSRLAEAQRGHSPLGFLSPERIDSDAATIADREAQNALALSLIESAPVFGQGLGYFVETTGTTLHNSLLWLVVETGLVGAAIVIGFLMLAVHNLYIGRDDPFLLGMVAVACAFAAMSATGEYLYQRHLWLLLGMALAVPPVTPRRP